MKVYIQVCAWPALLYPRLLLCVRLLLCDLARHDSISKYEIGPKATDLTVLLALGLLDLSPELIFISEVRCLLNLDP